WTPWQRRLAVAGGAAATLFSAVAGGLAVGRAALLVPVQPERARGAWPGPAQLSLCERRDTARRDRSVAGPDPGLPRADQLSHAVGDRRGRRPPLLRAQRCRLSRDLAGADERRR